MTRHDEAPCRDRTLDGVHPLRRCERNTVRKDPRDRPDAFVQSSNSVPSVVAPAAQTWPRDSAHYHECYPGFEFDEFHSDLGRGILPGTEAAGPRPQPVRRCFLSGFYGTEFNIAEQHFLAGDT